MKKLSLEIKDIADKINNKQGDLDMVHQLHALVSNYNFLYNKESKCVIDNFLGKLEPVFYATDDLLL
jgi:hypothetical protein